MASGNLSPGSKKNYDEKNGATLERDVQEYLSVVVASSQALVAPASVTGIMGLTLFQGSLQQPWGTEPNNPPLSPDTAELSSGEAKELQQIKWHRKQLLEDIQVCAHLCSHS